MPKQAPQKGAGRPRKVQSKHDKPQSCGLARPAQSAAHH